MTLEKPVPCHKCGKIPALRERWWSSWVAGPLLVTRWYECRRWLGLRLCQRGPEHTNERDWSDLAQRYAAMKWNAQETIG